MMVNFESILTSVPNASRCTCNWFANVIIASLCAFIRNASGPEVAVSCYVTKKFVHTKERDDYKATVTCMLPVEVFVTMIKIFDHQNCA